MSETGIANGRDQRRAPLEEQRAEGGEEQDGADHGGERQVVDRLVDVGRRPGDRRVDLDAGQAGPQLVERLIDAASHLERVGVRELLDHDQAVLAAGQHRVADQRLVVLDDVGDVAQAQRAPRRRPSPSRGHPRVTIGKMWRTSSRCWGVSIQPPRPGSRRLEEGQRRHPHGVAGRLDDLVQR